jgi:imidazole glycerol-phosphate synthase subunit HisH
VSSAAFDSAASDTVLIDAGGANLGSVRYALARLGETPRLVRDADELGAPARIILPGVGAAAPAMRLLRARGLDVALRASEAPLVGICLGMQLLFESSAESETTCLGLLPGRVEKLQSAPGLRVPHMGWNRLESRLRADGTPSRLMDGIATGDYAYFVHSYALPVADCTVAATVHSAAFSAAIEQGRFYGMQFHPERSSRAGLRMLANFLQVAA